MTLGQKVKSVNVACSAISPAVTWFFYGDYMIKG